MNLLAALCRATARLPGEYYVVDRPVDARGQYQLEMAGEFPLVLKRLVYFADDPPPPFTWRTDLEVFVPPADATPASDAHRVSTATVMVGMVVRAMSGTV